MEFRFNNFNHSFVITNDPNAVQILFFGGGGGADGWISSYIKHHDCVNHFD